MSLDVFLGHKGNILEPTTDDARQIKLDSPVLTEAALEKIKTYIQIPTVELSLVSAKSSSLLSRLDKLVEDAVEKVKAGAEILVLSDAGISSSTTYIPALLATGAVHHRLLEENLRSKCSIVVNTAQCWSTHHYATLIGYGASAICPYMAFETIRQEANGKSAKKAGYDGITVAEAQANYKKSVNAGILKILSKMGISLLTSYHGA